MDTLTPSSIHGHADSNTFSPSAASSIAGSSTLYSASSAAGQAPNASSAGLSGTDYLRDVFQKRIRNLSYLKRSLQGQGTWFNTVQLDMADLAVAFDNERMHKRTLRFFVLGLSLSSILEIPNPTDMARAINSLINELDGYTDDNIVSLTTGTGAATLGAQRPRMRSLFKSGKQSLKRSAAAHAISEFGTLDANLGPASTLVASDHNSYLIAPNVPFQLDFFHTFFTLCDMLVEIYYKMLSFLPRDAGTLGAEGGASSSATLPRAASPPTSASRHASHDLDRAESISQAFAAAGFAPPAAGQDGSSDADKSLHGLPTPAITGVTQELLLKADAKIRKTIGIQVKDIDAFARQMIKDELSSIDPLLKELGLDAGTGSSIFAPGAGASSVKSGSSIGGLPTSSGSALPFSMSNRSSSSSTAYSTTSSASAAVPQRVGGLPSHLRQGRADSRSSQDAQPGHYQFNLASMGGANASDGGAPAPSTEQGQGQRTAADGEPATGGFGSLIRSRSGRLRRVMSGDRPSSSGGPPLPAHPQKASTPPADSASQNQTFDSPTSH